MTRWGDETDGRGATYDDAWESMAARGDEVHGEADLVTALLDERHGKVEGARVMDAGCGTGRVAIELARRRLHVVGVDLDASMLDRAREKAPALDWRERDLSTMDDGDVFDLVVLAGNVLIYVTPGSEDDVVAAMARHLRHGGLLVAGFQLQRERFSVVGPDGLDAIAAKHGLTAVARWATWDRDPWTPTSDYAVSVFTRSSTH